jgi:hypothetical protein
MSVFAPLDDSSEEEANINASTPGNIFSVSAPAGSADRQLENAAVHPHDTAELFATDLMSVFAPLDDSSEEEANLMSVFAHSDTETDQEEKEVVDIWGSRLDYELAEATKGTTAAAKVQTKREQFESALRFCRQHKGQPLGARAALNKNPGRWPLVSRSALHRFLKGDYMVSKTVNHHRAVLLDGERQDLATCMGLAADAGCGFRKPDRNYALIDILQWRHVNNEAGGRGFVKLSDPAKRTLKRGKGSKPFWRGFFTEFSHLSPNHQVWFPHAIDNYSILVALFIS